MPVRNAVELGGRAEAGIGRPTADVLDHQTVMLVAEAEEAFSRPSIRMSARR
jgi:hypothetical protein